MSAVDLFAGPGGWDVAARELGIETIGVERDAAACATRAAAGHLTIRADVDQYPPERFAGMDGLIASPPCQDFSLAGKGAGRTGDKGQLIDVVPLWVEALRPRWIACEQVPPCLPIWREHAARYRELGYSTWVGVLNAANFGVPQTRKRAFLIASLERAVQPPEPTHGKDPTAGLFDTVLPWVSMADALGWSPPVFVRRERSGDRADEGFDPVAVPCQAMTSKTRSWVVNTGTNSMRHSRRVEDAVPYTRPISRPSPTIDTKAVGAWTLEQEWALDRPATTIVGSFCPDVGAAPGYRTEVSRQNAEGSIKITERDALILQSCDPDYPVQGSRSKRFEQIGNMVPPLLARHVLSSVATL